MLEKRSQRVLLLTLLSASVAGYLAVTSFAPRSFTHRTVIGFIVTGGADANEVIKNGVMSRDAWEKAQVQCCHFDGLNPIDIGGSSDSFDQVMERIGFNAKLVCETHSDRRHNVLMRILAALGGPFLVLTGLAVTRWTKRGEVS